MLNYLCSYKEVLIIQANMKFYDTMHFHRHTEFVFYQQEELVRLCIMEKETEIQALVWINLGIIKLLLTGGPACRLCIASVII